MEQTETQLQTRTDARFSTMDLCLTGAFTAVIAILAQISIPMPAGVPMTLQTLAVPLAGIVLGAKRGTTSALLYVLLAAVGVPVLAGMNGGIGAVFGMTGGFVFSFPLMALAAGLPAARGTKSPLYWLGLIIGTVINYAVGTAWFMFVTGTALAGALTACVLPFIPTTIIKILLAGLLGALLRRILTRAGLLT
ncbi:MAG: biotin transporter BioY [Lachnospiraceae bacterium]|nr:biotin transporter BioY [Lachnospiraceae bacterium]